ncbi:MAG: cyclase family protein, partial [Saprospiraceae bacterium]|nr:cyclase family protein [Saprospiraceae bacterium]
KGLPQVHMEVFKSHEEWDGEINPQTITPGVHKLEMGEHTGTHVDAINHMAKEYVGQSIDTMPLSMFYTEGICIDLSHKDLSELIAIEDLKEALTRDNLDINKGDTLLIYTDHYRRHFNTEHWPKGPGLSIDAARWLGESGIVAFGVETMSPGIHGISNREVHQICGELQFTHYENMINLHLLIGRGRFRFIGLPLKIRGGTGSPVRAIAVFE